MCLAFRVHRRIKQSFSKLHINDSYQHLNVNNTDHQNQLKKNARFNLLENDSQVQKISVSYSLIKSQNHSMFKFNNKTQLQSLFIGRHKRKHKIDHFVLRRSVRSRKHFSFFQTDTLFKTSIYKTTVQRQTGTTHGVWMINICT